MGNDSHTATLASRRVLQAAGRPVTRPLSDQDAVFTGCGRRLAHYGFRMWTWISAPLFGAGEGTRDRTVVFRPVFRRAPPIWGAHALRRCTFSQSSPALLHRPSAKLLATPAQGFRSGGPHLFRHFDHHFDKNGRIIPQSQLSAAMRENSLAVYRDLAWPMSQPSMRGDAILRFGEGDPLASIAASLSYPNHLLFEAV